MIVRSPYGTAGQSIAERSEPNHLGFRFAETQQIMNILFWFLHFMSGYYCCQEPIQSQWINIERIASKLNTWKCSMFSDNIEL